MFKYADKKTGEVIEGLYKDNEGQLKYIAYNERNYIVKECGDGKVELCFYQKPFIVPEVTVDYVTSTEDLFEFEHFCSTRKWKNVNGTAVRIDETAKFSDLIDSLHRGNKRAIKNFYDYALTNEWEYFVTLTFSDADVMNKYNVMADTWKMFMQKIKRKFPDVKALATYEEFEKGGYHIHAMLSDCNLTLIPARNHKVGSEYYGKFMFSEFGPQLFNCKDWNFGFNTVCCITPDSCQAQIVNYMSKYMNKDCPASYGNRRFYKTQNLTARTTIVGKTSFVNPLVDIIDKFGLKFAKKDNSGNLYFRNY